MKRTTTCARPGPDALHSRSEAHMSSGPLSIPRRSCKTDRTPSAPTTLRRARRGLTCPSRCVLLHHFCMIELKSLITLMLEQGNDTADIECTACPPGMYNDGTSNKASVSCLPCPDGTYASAPGSTSCSDCTDCASLSVAQLVNNSKFSLGSCPFEPARDYCVPAMRSMCTDTSDAECMLCPTLSEVGGYDVRGGVCVACKPGYFYNASIPEEGRRCVPCPQGFYCPYSRRGEIIECPATMVIRRDGDNNYTILPTTAVKGAYRMEQCLCSLSGGFEVSPYSQALFGCVACADGHYHDPAENTTALCKACPSGKFSSQEKGLLNYRECVQDIFARPLTFKPGCTPTSAPPVDAGAIRCTPCPDPDRPYTWVEAAASAGDCR